MPDKCGRCGKWLIACECTGVLISRECAEWALKIMGEAQYTVHKEGYGFTWGKEHLQARDELTKALGEDNEKNL